MKRKMMIVMCCVLILYALTGCQLAQENMGIKAQGDRLVGIFITTDHRGPLDFEERLYATLMTRTLTNEETGEIIETEEYIFEGIEGIPYFSPTIPATVERDSYISSMSDDAISDGYTSINFSDDKNSKSLEGTIYTAPSAKEHVYYFNSVYQSADGSVYATAESGGFMIHNESYSEGRVFSTTLDSTTTVTENGKAKTDSFSIEISIDIMFMPEKIAILQMDADSRLLLRAEYVPDAMPEAFTPEPDTVYLIVETYKKDGTGNLKTSREIYDKDAENIEIFKVRTDNICIKHLTQIEWHL